MRIYSQSLLDGETQEIRYGDDIADVLWLLHDRDPCAEWGHEDGRKEKFVISRAYLSGCLGYTLQE